MQRSYAAHKSALRREQPKILGCELKGINSSKNCMENYTDASHFMFPADS